VIFVRSNRIGPLMVHLNRRGWRFKGLIACAGGWFLIAGRGARHGT
jgi:hypothetical protein